MTRERPSENKLDRSPLSSSDYDNVILENVFHFDVSGELMQGTDVLSDFHMSKLRSAVERCLTVKKEIKRRFVGKEDGIALVKPLLDQRTKKLYGVGAYVKYIRR